MMNSRYKFALLSPLCALLALPALADRSNDFADEQGEVVQYEGKQFVRVANARQFLRSIISGVNILVARNTEINLTPLLGDEEWWQNNNPYFKWYTDIDRPEELTGVGIVSQAVVDGRQLCIVNYKDISIVGEGNCCIVVEPRYAFCLNFVNCSDISLQGLTIGHTVGGNCLGGVIGVSGGTNFSIYDCNLYGCGTYGLQLSNTHDFSMYDSSIHDCTYGIMTLNNVSAAHFERCSFYRNREYGLVESNNSNLNFIGCRFYQNNPTSFLFNVDSKFYLTDCHIYHPAEYLGSIELAEQAGNVFDNDPNNAEFSNGSEGAEKIKVNFKGSCPTMVDFINATIGNGNDEESDCDDWILGWKRYQRNGQGGAYSTYIVDERNGYVRIETKYPGEKMLMYQDFCYWNCADGAHKLFAHSSGILQDSKAIETECTGMTFYLYDNKSNVISLLGVDNYVLGGRPCASNDISFLLPRTGKDITYVDADGKRGIIRWNGNGFGKVNINDLE